MAKYDGDDMVLKINISSTYTAIAGCISHTATLSNNTVDLSDKDSNRWGDKSNFGPRDLSVSFNGWVNDNAAYDLIEDAAVADTSTDLQLAYGNGKTVTSNFFISDFTWTGEHGSAQTFSCTLANDGEPTFA